MLNVATQELGNASAQTAEFFQRMAAALMDGSVCMLDLDGHVVGWNAEAESMYGYSSDEILNQPFDKFHTRESRETGKARRLLAQVLSEGRAEDEEWWVRKDGTRFWAKVHILPLMADGAGSVTGFAQVTRDLTLARRTQEALERSTECLWQVEQQYQFLIDSVPDSAVFSLDAEARVSNWNATAQRMTGYRSDEIIGRPLSHFFTEEDLRLGKPSAWLNQAKEEGCSRQREWWLRNDGVRVFVESALSPVYSLQGTVNGFVLAIRESGEKGAAGSGLIRENWDLAPRKLKEAVIVITRGDTVIYVNKKAAEIAGVLTGRP